MKIKYIILLVGFLFSINQLFSQLNPNIIYKYSNVGDTVNLKIDNSNGLIQWQQSVDSISWVNIPGQVYDSLLFISNQSVYVRASIVYNNCDPYYSDTLRLIALDTTNLAQACPGAPTVSDFDGHIYNTLRLGNQCWMQSNVKSMNYADGTAIPYVSANASWEALGDNNEDKGFCYYNNYSSNGDIYGALYTWAAAMNGSASSNSSPSGVQGICPYGWHLPSDNEWKQLESFLGMDSNELDLHGFRGTTEGGKLKETGTTHWNSPNLAATNTTSFFGLGGGARLSTGGEFLELKNTSPWWSSTSSGVQNLTAYIRTVRHDKGSISRQPPLKSQGFYIRCLKDTIAAIPIVVTLAATTVNQISGTVSGKIINDAGSAITSRGFCWNTTGNPDLTDSVIFVNSNTISYDTLINGLENSTIYYVKAFATNSTGTGYGMEQTFRTFVLCPPIVSDFEGNEYKTVLIEDWCWMQENIKSSVYADGTSIPYVGPENDWVALMDNNFSKGYCYYDNDSINYKIYGGLYTWAAAMNSEGGSDSIPSRRQGICPDNWEIPSRNQFDQLLLQYGGSSEAGGELKESGEEHWDWPNVGASNSSGFTALPGGLRYHDSNYTSNFNKLRNNALFWSSSEYTNTKSYALQCYYNSDNSGYIMYQKSTGVSVRCIMNPDSVQVGAPMVKLHTMLNIADSTAQASCDVLYNGGSIITDRGICWNTTGSPTTADAITSNNGLLGMYLSSLAALSPNTNYYARAYASNIHGTSYSNEIMFSTQDSILLPFICGDSISDAEGQSYATIEVGAQCWMQENLNSSYYSNGSHIPLIESKDDWDDLNDNNTDKAYCVLNWDVYGESQVYGALYTWAAATNGSGASNSNPSGIQGICPNGWHLPSNAEIIELANTLGGNSVAGGKLKEAGLTHWTYPNTATNSSGFTALPGGNMATNGDFNSMGTTGFWWTSSQQDSVNAEYFKLRNNSEQLSSYSINKSRGFSIRCVKD